MVDWQSPQVIELITFLFIHVVYLLLGTYSWYLVLSFHQVELALLRRRIRFQIAHVPYLVGRYSHLTTLVTIISTNPVGKPPSPTPPSCSTIGLLRLISISGDIALTAASCNLAVRAIALWKECKTIACLLWCTCFFHVLYALVMGIVGVSGNWDVHHMFCIIGVPSHARDGLLVFYVFTISWGLMILTMTVLGIRRNELPRDSPLSSALFTQGVGYVVITLLTCIPMGVMSFLRLNQAMNVFLLPAGCTVSVIASSASVTSLFELKPQERSELPQVRMTGEHIAASDQSDKVCSNMFSTIIHTPEYRFSSEIVIDEP